MAKPQAVAAGAALRFELILCKKYPFAYAPGGAKHSVVVAPEIMSARELLALSH